MNKFALTLGLALAASTGTAVAEKQDMSQHPMEMQAATQTRHEGHGIIKAVNEQAHKVQIAHEAISDLHWPAMTMWFALRDSLPKDLRPGDSVSFELERTDSNTWAITHIDKR